MADIREVMQAAYEKAGGESDADMPPAANDNVPVAANDNPLPATAAVDIDTASSKLEAPEPQPGRDDKGRFAPKGEAPAAQPSTHPPPGPSSPATASATPATATPTPPQSSPDLRAPQSWKPAIREKWAAVPREVQEEISRRESEVRRALEESAPAKKLAQEFEQTVAPYRHLIQAEGSTPLQAVSNLLQTATALRTAPPAHKAQLVANLVKQFGVPIDALDAALAGEQPPPGQAAHIDPTAIVRQAKQELMQELAQQRQQALAAKAQQEAQAFMQNPPEFFEDVRDTMADLIQTSAQRGVVLSMQQAYDKACLIDDNVRAVLQQRSQAQHATNAQASTERAKLASSSVKGQPAAPKNGAPRTLREQIEAQYNAIAGR